MSNEELIKQFYVAFKNHDKETYLKLCHKNIEWQTAEGMPNGGNYIGVDQVFENYFPNMLKNFKEFHAIPEQILDLKEHIMVTGKYVGISKKDKEFEVRLEKISKENEKLIEETKSYFRNTSGTPASIPPGIA